jgi:hypothetical protein
MAKIESTTGDTQFKTFGVQWLVGVWFSHQLS